MRRPMFRWLAVVLALVLTAAACGDDDSGGDAATGSTTSTTTAESSTTETTVDLSGPPVKLMVMYEGSGSVATPEVPEGAKAAAEAINRAGGIDGSPIELMECDLKNDPNAARDCGSQAVDAGVTAVVSPVSANAGEYMPLLEQAQIPVVGNVPASAADFTSPASFPLYGGIVTASAGLADVLVSDGGASKISLARIDLAAASAIGVFANASLKRHDLAVVNDVAIPVGAPDMATYVASVLQGGTDGVLVGLSGQDATNFIIQLRQTAPDVPISATTTEFAAVVKALGDAATGIYVTNFYETADTAPDAWQTYVDDLKAVGFEETSGFRRNAYASVKVVAQVLTDAGGLTAADLWAALPQAEGVETGITPPLQFKTGGVGGVPRIFNACGAYQQLQADGTFKTVSDGFIDMFTGEPC